MIEKLKEAVEQLNKIINYDIKQTNLSSWQIKRRKQIKDYFNSLVQKVIDLSGSGLLPEEKKLLHKDRECYCWKCEANRVHNACRTETLLRMVGIKERIKYVLLDRNTMGTKIYELHPDEIAQAITKSIMGGGE